MCSQRVIISKCCTRWYHWQHAQLSAAVTTDSNQEWTGSTYGPFCRDSSEVNWVSLSQRVGCVTDRFGCIGVGRNGGDGPIFLVLFGTAGHASPSSSSNGNNVCFNRVNRAIQLCHLAEKIDSSFEKKIQFIVSQGHASRLGEVTMLIIHSWIPHFKKMFNLKKQLYDWNIVRVVREVNYTVIRCIPFAAIYSQKYLPVFVSARNLIEYESFI